MHVEWSSLDETKESATLLDRNLPNGQILKGCFGIVDGGEVPCSDYIDWDVQNEYYEGYVTLLDVVNLLVYNANGELVHYGLNFSGSWPDFQVASHLGLLLKYLFDEMTPVEYRTICGIAVTSAGHMKGNLLRARKADDIVDILLSEEVVVVDVIVQKVMPGERQITE